MTSSKEKDIVVIDTGASYIRLGVHRKSIAPQIAIPSILGTVKAGGGGGGGEREFIGNAARRPMCNTRCPIENGKVNAPDDLARLISHCYDIMALDPSQHQVIVTESPTCDALDRMTLARVLFDILHVPAAQVIPQGLCGLLSFGRTSGIAVDSGENLTNVTAVCDGIVLPSCSRSTSAAGGAVTEEFLQQISHGRGSVISRDLAKEWKERYCFCSLEFDEEVAQSEALQRDVELPDGNVIKIGSERCTAPESVLFRSHERAFRSSVSDILAASILSIDESLQPQLMTHVGFMGGTCEMSNFTHRVLFETSCEPKIGRLSTLLSTRVATLESKSDEVAPSDRNWIGAAIWGGLSTAQELFVSNESIREEGLQAFSTSRFIE